MIPGLEQLEFDGYRRVNQKEGVEYILTYGVLTKDSKWTDVAMHVIFGKEQIEYFVELFPKESGEPIGVVRFWPQSEANFDQVFTPQPNINDKRHFSHDARVTISARETGNQNGDGGGWFFTPPPLALGLQRKLFGDRSLMVGLAPAPGHYNFNSFEYIGEGRYFGFRIDYGGHEKTGQYGWISPRLILRFADNPIEGITAYRQMLQDRGWVATPKIDPDLARDFHRYSEARAPIATNWGNMLAHSNPVPSGYYPNREETLRAEELNTQTNMENWLSELEQANINPGIVIVDTGWGTDLVVRPDRWPHMKQFIDAQHAKGRRVVLWMKLWDPPVAPDANVIRNDRGSPVPIDPTNPAFASLLKKRIQALLSADGLDADGVKVDYSANVPSIDHFMTDPAVAGIELIHRYLKLIHDAATRAKPSAIILAQTANPYFLDVVNMIRRNDGPYTFNSDSYARAMEYRGEIATAAGFQWQDADGWPIANLQVLTEYLHRLQDFAFPNIFYARRMLKIAQDKGGIRTSSEELSPDELAQVAKALQSRLVTELRVSKRLGLRFLTETRSGRTEESSHQKMARAA
jgi:hypothetical protein